MTHRSGFLALATASALLFAAFGPEAAFAQNAPGSPDGVLQQEFQFNQPETQWNAKPEGNHFQHKVTKARKAGDDGDPNGCNLQCPNAE